jgi:hypothetical protein
MDGRKKKRENRRETERNKGFTMVGHLVAWEGI